MSGVRRGRATRNVAVVTGTRAEYGLLRSTMEAIAAHSRLRLQLVVTGMHLLKKFGHTVDEIRGDGWRIDAQVPMQRGLDDPLDHAEGLARGVRGIAQHIERLGTDWVVVLGDRVEAMAGALAATTAGRMLAHIHGGDVAPGDFDDRFRHAISKLATVHFAATKSAAKRLVRMGEEPSRVHVVGAPGFDRLRELLENAKPMKPKERSALVLYHPCGRTPPIERRVMTAILNAVSAERLFQTVIYPNSDRGHHGVIEVIEAYRRRKGNDRLRVIRSMVRDDYLRALVSAAVIVGNSSSGVIEACFAGTPAVNVGPRQRGREKGGRAVFDAGESQRSIVSATRKALRSRPTAGAPGPYGSGRVGPRIADLLSRTPVDASYAQKVITY